MQKHYIAGVHITDRLQHALPVQELLTQYGHLIKTRLGLHDTGSESGAPNGLLILELLDREGQIAKFCEKLNAIEGVEVQQMVFDHP